MNGHPTLTLTNLTAEDAGVYDFIGVGGNLVSSKLYLRVQTNGAQGVFNNPRINGSNFVSDFSGATSRSYEIQMSTNLISWTVINGSGPIAWPNTSSNSTIFLRSRLLPTPPPFVGY